MVSGSKVSADLSSLSSIFQQYETIIGDLAGHWKGLSYDNLENKGSQFCSEFSSAISSQMSSFASACDLYISYKEYKSNLQILKSNYQQAVNNKDYNNVNSFANQISSTEKTMQSLKSQIESLLSSVSSIQLESNVVSNTSDMKDVDDTSAKSVSEGVEGAINWALDIANDDSYGYSQNTRWGNPNYDCSSFVISAYQAAGIDVKGAGATYTGNMKNAFTSVGFTWIPGNPSVEDLQPGDILLNESSHTEMYIGDGKNIGAHSDYDGYDGDSSGREVSVSDYYSHPWDGVLRYTGE